MAGPQTPNLEVTSSSARERRVFAESWTPEQPRARRLCPETGFHWGTWASLQRLPATVRQGRENE